MDEAEEWAISHLAIVLPMYIAREVTFDAVVEGVMDRTHWDAKTSRDFANKAFHAYHRDDVDFGFRIGLQMMIRASVVQEPAPPKTILSPDIAPFAAFTKSFRRPAKEPLKQIRNLIVLTPELMAVERGSEAWNLLSAPVRRMITKRRNAQKD